MHDPITIEALVDAPTNTVWQNYTEPAAVKEWNTASDDWHTTDAKNDLRAGGRFVYRMEAKDGSRGFDFAGSYDEVRLKERIAYTIDDGRQALVTFTPEEESTRVTITFEAEAEHAREVQQSGWQAILDNFKRYVDAKQ